MKMGKSRQFSYRDENARGGKLLDIDNQIYQWSELFAKDMKKYILFEMNNFTLIKIKRGYIMLSLKCNSCDELIDDCAAGLKHLDTEEHKQKMKELYEKKTAHYCANSLPPTIILSKLSSFLEEVVCENAMTLKDREMKVRVAETIKKSLPEFGIAVYGSVVHGLGSKSSDINLFITCEEKIHDNPASVLAHFERAIQSSAIGRNVHWIKRTFLCNSHTLMFNYEDNGGSYPCNIRILEPDNIRSTAAFMWIAKIHPMVHKLIVLLKCWSKKCCLNSSFWPKYVPIIIVVAYLQSVKSIKVLPLDHSQDPKDFAQDFDCLGSLWIGLLQYIQSVKSVIHISFDEYQSGETFKIAGQLSIQDPYYQVSQSKVKHLDEYDRSQHTYVERCIDKSLIHFFIPRTLFGPIVGFILEPENNFGLKLSVHNIKHYIGDNVLVIKKAFQLLTSTDDNYNPNDEEDINLGIKELEASPYTTVFNIDFLRPQVGESTHQLPILNMYNIMGCFPPIFKYLINQLKADRLVFDFDSTNLIPTDLSSKCMSSYGIECKCCDVAHPSIDFESLSDHTVGVVNLLLGHVAAAAEPSRSYIKRLDEVRKYFRITLLSVLPDSDITPFGSLKTGFLTSTSDLNLSLSFHNNPDGSELDTPNLLSQLKTELNDDPEISTRKIILQDENTQVLKCIMPKSEPGGVNVTISYNNVSGLLSAELINCYLQIDNRLKVLVFALKKLFFTQQFGCKNLSTYALIIMVIHFLQRCSPPALPMLQELKDLKAGNRKGEQEENDSYFYKNVNNLKFVWKDYGKNKRESSELWIGMLRYYAEQINLDTDIVSIRTNKVTKFEKGWNLPGLCVEDPFINNNLTDILSTEENYMTLLCLKKAYNIFTLLDVQYDQFRDDYEKLANIYFTETLLKGIKLPKTPVEEVDSDDEFVLDPSKRVQISFTGSHTQDLKALQLQTFDKNVRIVPKNNRKPKNKHSKSNKNPPYNPHYKPPTNPPNNIVFRPAKKPFNFQRPPNNAPNRLPDPPSRPPNNAPTGPPVNPPTRHPINPPNRPINPPNRPINPPNRPINPPNRPINPPNRPNNPNNRASFNFFPTNNINRAPVNPFNKTRFNPPNNPPRPPTFTANGPPVNPVSWPPLNPLNPKNPPNSANDNPFKNTPKQRYKIVQTRK